MQRREANNDNRAVGNQKTDNQVSKVSSRNVIRKDCGGIMLAFARACALIVN